ncbi:FIST N-terminal domain-containing protein [Aquincola sp. MAHUQ-54]|uniref:FIST N-terminal domain-containing protein n=1 Tax=Aquincola agrisoli TaxID=3119538 RepID=A0AAW9Q7U7_9BURK
MHVCTSEYRPATGWVPALPAGLDGHHTLVLVFGAGGFIDDPAPFFDLADAFPSSVHLGCSSGGEISGDWLLDDTLTVAVVRFEHARLHAATTTVAELADSEDAGARLAAQMPRKGLRMVFAVSDGLCVDGTALLRGLTRCLPEHVPVTGGMAGDRGRLATTWVYGHDRHLPAPARACLVGLYGERLCFGQGHATGWADLGPERRITRARGNVLFELDGQPALELYKRYLGELAMELPGSALRFPLSVRRAEGPGPEAPLVRSVLAVDEARRALVLSGSAPVGGMARLMRTRVDDLVASAAQASAAAAARLPAGAESLVISVSCLGRRIVMGERTGDELDAVLDHGARACGRVGFYSFGEFSPALPGGCTELHHQTLALTALAEA